MPRLPIPGSDSGNWGNILNEYLSVAHNADGTLNATATDVGATPGVRVGAVMTDPTEFGGNFDAGEWTIAAFAPLQTSGDIRLMAVIGTNSDDVLTPASNGLFEHVGGGVFQLVRAWSMDDAGLIYVSQIELIPDAGGLVALLNIVGGTDLGYTLLTDADLTALTTQVGNLETQADNLETRLNRYYPENPVVPHLHVSKYVTFDPNFPLDGSAAYVGGQLISDGQNITILSNDSGTGGVWTLSTSGPATRAQGLGAMVSSDIGNYDHVSYTGTRWAYFSLFRLYGDPTDKGLAPVPPDNTGITGGEGVNRVYRPDLIATTRSGDSLDVLNPDGTVTTLTISVDLTNTVICVLVLDTLNMLTIANGAVEMSENFTRADGIWIAVGAANTGTNTVVSTNGFSGHVVLSVNPDIRATLDDFESRISALEP